MSNSLQPHGLQHARPPCPSPTPGVHSDSHRLSQWCHPTISSTVVPFSSHFQFFLASGSFSNESVLLIRWPKFWNFSPDLSELETQPSSLYHYFSGILTYTFQRIITVLVAGFVFYLGLPSLRLKAAMGRDLATRVHGAIAPFRGTQEALKCALSLFVIRLSFLFTEEETGSMEKMWLTCPGPHTSQRQSHQPLEQHCPPKYNVNPTRNFKISSSHILKM